MAITIAYRFQYILALQRTIQTGHGHASIKKTKQISIDAHDLRCGPSISSYMDTSAITLTITAAATAAGYACTLASGDLSATVAHLLTARVTIATEHKQVHSVASYRTARATAITSRSHGA